MADDALTSVDTVTIAALLRALQVVITAYQNENPDPAQLRAVEARAIAEIKALDTGEFTYEEQAEGLAEGLLFVRSMFRYAHATAGKPQPPAAPEPAALPEAAGPEPTPPESLALAPPFLHLHRQ